MSTQHSSGRAVGWLVLLMLALSAGPAVGKYLRPDLVSVPVDRLIINLRQQVHKNPRNVQALINLARTHAMAYALKTNEIQVVRGHEDAGPWLGHTPRVIPFAQVEKTNNAQKRRVAMSHLNRAIARYQEALRLDPKNLAARLGYAWTLEQANKKQAAITAYRQLIREAWAREKDLPGLPLGGHTITVEAADYLIPMLDKKRDRQEIATLHERVAHLQRLPRPITPLAVPLRDGLSPAQLEDRSAAVAFDLDGTGRRQKWTWLNRDAAWLVYAPGSRVPKSGLQLFGNVSFWLFWSNGYEALSALDDNGDGWLTGPELRDLALWQDRNGNGVCDPGELKSLAEYGVVAVCCRSERDRRNPQHLLCAPVGLVFRDGRTRPTYDLLLHRR